MMSLSPKQLYEFGEFRLDTKEKILMCGGEPVELTPKAFELLTFFVENPGRLLKKDEIMEKIWAESFVEESNLTFNIGQLRKILKDDAQTPTFIKTVRQHGYRFIAPVKEVIEEPSAPAIEEPPSKSIEDISKIVSETTNKSLPNQISRPNIAFAGLAVLLIAGLAGALFLYGYFKSKTPNAPVLSAPFALEKISNNGKVVIAAISPDGKKVVYVSGRGRDKQSIWLRRLEDDSNTPIIPASDDLYTGLALSPDGETLYFVRRQRQAGDVPEIYRVSIFGGIPNKIVSNATEGWISISPDGKQISYVRCPRRDDENCALFVADTADGQNERKLDSRPPPFRIGDNQFSHDGKKIAFAVGQSRTGANEFGLAEIDLETGTKRDLLQEKFFNIKNLVWLPDQSGWLMTARKSTESNFRIMQVSAVTGQTQLLTKDAEVYSVLSLSKDGTKLVCTKVRQDFKLRLVNLENPAESRVLTDATSAAFAPDGKIYFSSSMSGNNEIWSVNPDGSNQRQLTNHPAEDAVPVVAPDGNSIFYTSTRTGVGQVWRMNSDGSNQTQITDGKGGRAIFVSADGQWIYYQDSLSGELRQIFFKSGEEKVVFNKAKAFLGISPDGSQIAYAENQNGETVLAIAAITDGQTVRTFRLADPKGFLLHITWMPDGKGLVYITANREYENYTLWKQSLNENASNQIVELGDDELGAFSQPISPDGKTFAIVQGEWLHDAVLLKGLQ
jgi:Tol biopolymer transport system component/DNA-binding winged helix-turn-helix (wHTH) protein